MMTITPTMLPIIIPAVEESENSKDKIKSKYSLHATPKVYILISCKLPTCNSLLLLQKL